MRIEKERSKSAIICRCYDYRYRKPKELYRQIIRMNKKLGKFTRYEINIHKSVLSYSSAVSNQ